MKTTILNEQNEQITKIFQNGYGAEYKGTIHPPNREVEVVNDPIPDYDDSTHRLINEGYGYDAETDTWRQTWRKEPLTEREIALKDWDNNETWDKRIIVPSLKSLKMEMANVIAYWNYEGMPLLEKEGLIFLYCNEILTEEHQSFIDLANQRLQSKGYTVVIENKPQILNT